MLVESLSEERDDGAMLMTPASKKRAAFAVGFAAALATVASGCKKKDSPGEGSDDPALLAQDGSEASAVETDNELLTSTLVASSTTGGSLSLASAPDLGGGDLAGQDLGDGARLLFFPRGCLAVTHDAAARTVTYRFTECTGPNGLFKITGEVKATYAAAPNELDLDLVGSALKINKATVDWSAHARITAKEMQRTMEWKAQLSGTTARGREISRTNEKVVTWKVGERCIGVSGKAEGDVKGRNLRTEITDYRRCQGACPEAGGKITITNAATGTKVEISFDGSDRGTVTAKGQTTTFTMACGG
jgi:hypothetical protein